MTLVHEKPDVGDGKKAYASAGRDGRRTGAVATATVPKVTVTRLSSADPSLGNEPMSAGTASAFDASGRLRAAAEAFRAGDKRAKEYRREAFREADGELEMHTGERAPLMRRDRLLGRIRHEREEREQSHEPYELDVT